jgi:hypothetical protein
MKKRKSIQKPKVEITTPATQPETTQTHTEQADPSSRMPQWMSAGFFRARAEIAKKVVISDDFLAHGNERIAATG